MTRTEYSLNFNNNHVFVVNIIIIFLEDMMDEKELKKYNFGVNMRKWVKDHENYVLHNKGNLSIKELRAWHERKLAYLQHERLIHLIVTLLTAMAVIFAIGVFIFFPEGREYTALFVLGLMILLAFYFRHYFFLENTVQKWYMIDEELHNREMKAENS